MKSKELSLEKNAAIQAAENEAPFSARNILQELSPLLKSYYIGKLRFVGEAIFITFLNGQKFRITAEEV